MFDINNIFPYLQKSKRVKILGAHHSRYYPRIGDKPLSKKRIIELEHILGKLEANILKLDKCMAIHSKRIISTRSPYILTKELINLLVEAEMKRRTLINIKKLKMIIKSQKKLFK
ncbi:hypothetical protein J7J26_03335 [Candidatus Micrarchaeota archaeon]|nr:hypothetical protein [Candidatus Micrarchaeota archaeon]